MNKAISPLSPVGSALRQWRDARGVSQLALALRAETSARHISFIETGRAQPSRAMIMRLAQALDLPLRGRNELLAAAGFAALYPETSLSTDEDTDLTWALGLILDKHEPYPAIVVNRHWDLVMANHASTRVMGFLGIRPDTSKGPPNVLRMMFDPDQLRQYVENWEDVARVILNQTRKEALGAGADDAMAALFHEVLSYPGIPSDWRSPDLVSATKPYLPVTFVKDGTRLAWFTVISTFGTPRDVTLQELRIETFFPADPATEAFAQKLSEDG